MSFPVIDAHQHFWKYVPSRDTWMTDDLKMLRRDYLPADLEPLFAQNGIRGTIVVQADPSEDENEFLLGLAAQHPFIQAIVGWVDLQSDFVEERLEYYQQFSVMKGFRHLLQGEQQRDLMLNRSFQNGIALLNRYRYSFDLLILPDQLEFCLSLAESFPEQRFVIDHLAKPPIKKGAVSEWKIAIEKFKPREQVYCKISGMVTEADWKTWKPGDFYRYMDVVVETFGTKRIMFGSDWPVCLAAAGYSDVKRIVTEYFDRFSETEKADFFSQNATVFYQLSLV